MISLIAAYDRNFLIGNKNKLPWNIPGELERFKNLTTNNVVLLGRKTFEGMKPLKNRLTLVITHSPLRVSTENLRFVSSVEEAVKISRELKKNLYIAGGAEVYSQALPLCERLFITEIDEEFFGDTYFPKFDESGFEKSVDFVCEGEIKYKYLTYVRKYC